MGFQQPNTGCLIYYLCMNENSIVCMGLIQIFISTLNTRCDVKPSKLADCQNTNTVTDTYPDHGGGVFLLNSICEQIVYFSYRATFQKREREVRKPKYTTTS